MSMDLRGLYNVSMWTDSYTQINLSTLLWETVLSMDWPLFVLVHNLGHAHGRLCTGTHGAFRVLALITLQEYAETSVQRTAVERRWHSNSMTGKKCVYGFVCVCMCDEWNSQNMSWKWPAGVHQGWQHMDFSLSYSHLLFITAASFSFLFFSLLVYHSVCFLLDTPLLDLMVM